MQARARKAYALRTHMIGLETPAKKRAKYVRHSTMQSRQKQILQAHFALTGRKMRRF